MTAKDLKERAMKIWKLMLKAESAAVYSDYVTAWKLAYEAMELYQPIVDPIMHGEIVVAPKTAKKGCRA